MVWATRNGRDAMSKRLLSVCAALLAATVAGGCAAPAPAPAPPAAPVPGAGFAAIPGLTGGQDIFGPYDVVPDWPRPMSESLPGHEQWTYSVTMDVFAESPNRVLVASKGELPLIEKRPESIWLPQLGPGMQFPVFRLPLRQAGGGVPNGDQLDEPGNGRPGIDWRFEHSILVMNAEGKITEDWTRWDKMWTRPHDIEISPYDSEKHVWIVDAEGHGVYKFT